MKPPSRKHYEKAKPTYKELEDKLKRLEETARHALMDRDRYKEDYVMMGFLKRKEVFISDEEGMKYLTGEDLADYCKAGIIKEDEERHAGYQTISLGSFIQPYQQHINAIFDDVYKEHAERLTLTYKTKGRYK